MSLKLITAPSAEPLSLTEAKDQLRVTNGDQDDLITLLIQEAREYVEEETQRALITQTWELQLDEFPCGGADDYPPGGEWSYLYGVRARWSVIELPRPPLSSVTSIKYIDEAGNEQTLSPSSYQVESGGLIERSRVMPEFDAVWPVTRRRTPGAVKIRFVAGYGNAGSAVPAGLRVAMKMLVATGYQYPEAVSASGLKELPMPVGLQYRLAKYRSWRAS